jgi:hypothetical protein
MTGEMSVMGREGDLKVRWNSENPTEVEAAQTQFNQLRGKGYAAFRMNKDGTTGEQIDRFDARHESIILAPQMRGG